jgi:phosphatidylserine/phosphatidylglycerophosphate/cardiolipin synthase-like enzyme
MGQGGTATMRISDKHGALTARAIAGSYVVLFGMSLDGPVPDDFLGFSIERLDPAGEKQDYLDNLVLFEENYNGADSDHSSEFNPFQAFLWGDYTAKPEHEYTYRVSSRFGSPAALRTEDTVELTVTTEATDEGEHAIFFNRGAASSQAYALRFPDQQGKAPSGEALTWLSRGLEEALIAFIGQAKGSGWGLRAAIYELQYAPVLEAFGAAARAGADVKVVFDDIDNSEPATDKHGPVESQPSTSNLKAIKDAGIEDLCIPRKNSKYISHNKFIVLLKDGKPVQVWTGSTNVTEGGIYGHSNVGHQVRDPKVAAHFLGYWEELAGDPASDPLKDWTVGDTKAPAKAPEELLGEADPRPPQNTVGTVFSPRHGDNALDWYAKLMDNATSSVFLTAAFGVSKELQAIFDEQKPYLRYLLLDNRKGKIDTVARGIEGNPDNRVAAGAFIGHGGWHQWVEEKLTGLNNYVQYIHTKYMLIDPLGDDPIVISGSANFSDASTSENDENMLVIRGDTRVADIYLGEFMRLFTQFRLRGRIQAPKDKLLPTAGVPKELTADAVKFLKEESSWAQAAYVKDSPEETERLLFSGA